METRPPFWLVTLYVVQALLALAVLVVGNSMARSPVRGIAIEDVLVLSLPMIFVLSLGALSWWLWGRGKRLEAKLLGFLPLVSALCVFVALGMVI